MRVLRKMFILLMMLCLASCNPSETKLTDDTIDQVKLIDLVTSYQEKLTSIIENDDVENQPLLAKYSNLSFSENDPNYTSREAFLETYVTQRDNSQDVKLSPHLMIYKDLLDDVLEEIETLSIEEIEAQINVSFRNLIDLDAYVSITSDQGILIKLNLSIDNETYYYGIKMGYDNEDFYLRELSQHNEMSSFSYFEFLENHQMVDVRYTSESFWYRYQDQNDNTYYEISKEDSLFYNDFVLSWFNPETNVRTRIVRSGEGHMNLFEFFNEKGIFFEFLEYIDSDIVDVSWQLLEANGWDGVYTDENEPNSLHYIYKDGQRILTDASRGSYLTPMYANIRIKYSFVRSELTDDILNLSAYGLDFNHPELNMMFIEDTISNALDEYTHLSVYRGIDFLNDDLSQSLYHVIDDDIKP